MKGKDVWVAWSNSDLTEGRGRNIPLYICELKETATRLGKGKGVQASDCFVKKSKAYYINGKWFTEGTIIKPNTKDTIDKENNDKKRDIKERILSLGISEEELNSISK